MVYNHYDQNTMVFRLEGDDEEGSLLVVVLLVRNFPNLRLPSKRFYYYAFTINALVWTKP